MRAMAALVTLAAWCACASPRPVVAPRRTTSLRALTFADDPARVPNPERGFYRFVDPARPEQFAAVAAGGHTLAFVLVRLDAYRDAPLSDEALRGLSRALDAARDAGLKVVLRFAYNDGPFPDPAPDATPAQALAHVAQLRPVLRASADVIAVLQAGFVGAWGEWHSSARGLDAPDAQRRLVAALLEALPRDRSIQVRYPEHKARLVADGAVEAARVGHHNDCFLAGDDDGGTWPRDDRTRWRALVERDGLAAPVGGETCRPSPPRSDCAPALEELARMHYSFLNRDWHPGVTGRWFREGCGEEMERRLGYRLVLERAELPARVRRGVAFTAAVTLRNEGWAAMYNPRPVRAVLDCEGQAPAVADVADVDPRRWAPGARVRFEARVTPPAGASACRLALWLPDASPRLAARPAYAVRLANRDVWDAARGWNVLASIALE